MDLNDVIAELKSLGDPESAAGMAKYGIKSDRALGVSIPKLQGMAKKIGTSRKLAGQLWSSAIHEARILACMIEDPQQLTEAQLERWVKEVDSWDLCDQCCNRLFSKTAFGRQKAIAWSQRPEEFVKRAGFVLMAVLAVHDKEATDRKFEPFLKRIQKEASDGRHFVKKAVNWALRQIGKRNPALNRKAVAVAEDLRRLESGAARWVANDALRELRSEKIQRRLSQKVSR
ncbi:MAG: DNA alkylation repair protein [Desulfobacterales bacterium]|jgi:3-methyladenine DNA glycosylase AlkD